MPFIRHDDGPAVYAEKSRREAPTSSQYVNRRHALWLHANRIGLHDPVTGRVRPHSVSELAALWDLTPRAVRLGLENARRLATKEVADA